MKINIAKKINDVFNYKEFSNGDLEPLELPAYLLIKRNFSIKKPVKFFVWNKCIKFIKNVKKILIRWFPNMEYNYIKIYKQNIYFYLYDLDNTTFYKFDIFYDYYNDKYVINNTLKYIFISNYYIKIRYEDGLYISKYMSNNECDKYIYIKDIYDSEDEYYGIIIHKKIKKYIKYKNYFIEIINYNYIDDSNAAEIIYNYIEKLIYYKKQYSHCESKFIGLWHVVLLFI